MMAERTLRRIGDWNLQRYEYDGAPLTAVSDDGVDIDVDDDGDVGIEWTERADDSYGRVTRHVWIPSAVLTALIVDHNRRKHPAEEQATPAEPAETEGGGGGRVEP